MLTVQNCIYVVVIVGIWTVDSIEGSEILNGIVSRTGVLAQSHDTFIVFFCFYCLIYNKFNLIYSGKFYVMQNVFFYFHCVVFFTLLTSMLYLLYRLNARKILLANHQNHRKTLQF